MPVPRLTEHDEELILGLRVDEQGDLRGSRSIAKLMAERHGRDFHHSTIALVLKRRSEERQEVAREVLQEKLHGTITADLTVFDEVLRHEMEVYRAGKPLLEGGKLVFQPGVPLQAWTALGREVRETVSARLKLSGAGERTGRDDLAELSDEELQRAIEDVRGIAG